MITGCKVDSSFYRYCNFFSSKTIKSTFDKKSWYQDQPLHFDLSIQDISTTYDIYLVIKYDYSYTFSNLHINYFIGKKEDNQIIESGIRDINLFESTTGKALGSSLWPSSITLKFLILKDYKFPKTGDYFFVVQHAMRKLDLVGFKSIELNLIAKK